MQKDASRTCCFMCCFSQFINICETSQGKGSKGTLKLILVVRSLLEELMPWADRSVTEIQRNSSPHDTARECGGGGKNTPSRDPLLQVPQEGRSCRSRTLHQAVFDFLADQTAGKRLEGCVACDSLIF